MENKVLYTPSGEDIIPTYKKEFVDGRHQLIKTGTKNIYEEIQASKDECDIKKIMERCQCGDFSALNARKNPMYGDFSEANKTLNEFNQVQKQAQSNYDKLTEAEKAIVDKYLKGEKEQEKAQTQETIEEQKEQVNE